MTLLHGFVFVFAAAITGALASFLMPQNRRRK